MRRSVLSAVVTAAAVLALAPGGASAAQWFNGSVPVAAGTSQQSLASISCAPTTTVCPAVGSAVTTAGATVPLVVRFSTTGASTATTLAPSPGAATSLKGVSCGSIGGLCMAVGSYVVGAGPATRAIVETYNGTSWALSSPPVPAGATSSTLDSVSCLPTGASTLFCAAAGRYTDSVGTQRSLLETWNGTTWTVGPTTFTTAMHGVSCASTTACLAVGDNAAKLGWNGTTWVNYLQTVANSSLNGVSCRTISSQAWCSAVGSRVVSGVTQSFAQILTGGTGATTETTPTIAGTTTVLNGSSCPVSAAFQCVAVGVQTTTVSTPFAIQRGSVNWTNEVVNTPGGTGTMSGVSCSSSATADCRAVGTRVDALGNSSALLWVQG
jgi:hypothetical protein